MVALTHWNVSSFLKKTAVVLAPRLAVVFRRLLCLGSFPICWRVANVTPIPKGQPSSSGYNHRQISLTPILSKVFEHLVSVRLGRFMEGRGVLPTTQFAFRKGLGTCDALLCAAHTLQSALEMGQEARIVQIDFSALSTGSTIMGFSSSSVLWELVFQCCLF